MNNAESTYEIILVDDCSRDNTANIISQMARNDKNITSVVLAHNSGQPAALLAGFSQTTGDYIITCDDDGQSPISYTFDFIDKIKVGAFDVVCAKYTKREKQSLFRRVGTKVNDKMLCSFINKPKELYMSSFFCARKYVIKELLKCKTSNPYMAGMLLNITTNIGNIEVVQRQRLEGQSNYNIKKLFKLWMNGITGFSVKPLRFAFFIGVVFVVAGLSVFVSSLILHSKNMLPYIFSIVFIPFGVNMVQLGILGEYIGRSYMESKNQNSYIIKDIINPTNKDNNGFCL
jgi:undecaprenyl-phosphate 4-deoxy-4-formamido-L-arabinose transferase